LLKDWKKLISDSGASLYIGLASYKLNTDNEYEYTEWKNGDAVLEKETKICIKEEKVKGIVYFSYSSLFSKETLNTSARQKVKAVISR